jgi:hypothetical protein
MMKTTKKILALTGLSLCAGLAAAAPNTLDIYYIDTEGGQSTLFVAPSGQSVLVDTGFPGTRDPGRIMDAVHAAGLTQIDYLLLTHYHGDHVGGFLELSKRIPIAHLIDHGPTVQPEQNIESKQAWDAAIKTTPHIVPKPGDKLPVKGLDWTFVSSAGNTLATPMKGAPGAGKPNPYCADYKPKEITVDLEYALHPRVVVMNTGTRKGGQVETFETLESSPGLENIWQLHWAVNGGLEHNSPAVYIANIETAALTGSLIANPPPPPVMGTRPPDIGDPNHSPAWWIKVSASPDGSFTVTNARNGFSKTYSHR